MGESRVYDLEQDVRSLQKDIKKLLESQRRQALETKVHELQALQAADWKQIEHLTYRLGEMQDEIDALKPKRDPLP